MTGAAPADPQKGGTYFLGRYRVVDEIGIGGMASVHLARMDGPGGFQKWVAIKRIHSHLIEDDSFIQMFLDEARVAARISHPNVATVFDLGSHEGTYWIAMEYLHGEPLREVMRRTEELGAPMPPEIACRVIADAAEGLHAAHELLGKNGEQMGLVHRDVTPHNLFVTYDGTTKVVDFGIAKFASRMSQTRAGTLKGKLAYMSPEQVHGEAIDRRTDIFALGVVLWELTTGQRLFRMESDLDTLAKVQECNVPRPSTLVRGYPIDLEKIVMKALAKNRGERFKTAREFSRALQSLLMRRGLFIASDEVAAYTHSIFAERIQKREAHLRWAAEVTQTINIENALSPQVPKSIESSVNSFGSKEQAAPTAVQRGGGALGIPRPAAGAPAPARKPESLRPGPGRRQDSIANMANTAETPSFDEDGPTIQGVGLEPDTSLDDDEEFDDDGDTIITTAPREGPLARGAGPLPAAGRPASLADSGETHAAVPGAQPGRPGPQQARNPSLPAGYQAPPQESRPMQPPAPYPQANYGAPDFGGAPSQQQQQQQQLSMAHTVRGSASPSGPNDALPPAAILNPELALRLAPPTMHRFIPNDGRTMTAQSFAKRGLPMWAVAVASGVVALIFVALIYIILAPHTPTTPPKTVASNGSASAGGGASVPLTPNLPSTGPFGAARSAFSAVIVPPAVIPPPLPKPTAPVTLPPSANVDVKPSPPTPPPVAAEPKPPQRDPTPAPAPPRPAPAPKAAQGFLTVMCKPACDQVFDNGKSLGPSPIFRQSVAVGEHRLQFMTANPRVTKVVSTIISADELKVQTVTMTP
jgi:serine/threonine protein kinase